MSKVAAQLKDHEGSTLLGELRGSVPGESKVKSLGACRRVAALVAITEGEGSSSHSRRRRLET